MSILLALQSIKRQISFFEKSLTGSIKYGEEALPKWNQISHVSYPVNEPVSAYAPGSPERVALNTWLSVMLTEEVEIPLIISGKEVRTGRLALAVCPHVHAHRLAWVDPAGPEEVEEAVRAAKSPWRDRSETTRRDRSGI